MREWMLPGPAEAMLDTRAVAKFLGVNVRTLRRMIDDGEFPAGMHVGGRLTWSGSDIAAYLHLRGRFRRFLEGENRGQSGENRGHSGTNRDEDEDEDCRKSKRG